jgi:uncharacterized repeat protein (TIGR03803 family)
LTEKEFMKIALKSMEIRFTTLHVGRRTCATTELVPGRKPVLALAIRPSASGRARAKRRRVMRLLWGATILLPTLSAQAGVVLTILYSFTGSNDGGNPSARLLQGSDGYFYGTAQNGGTNNAGTVFKISAHGVLTNLYSFTGGNDGANPQAGLVQGGDGYFYGTSYDGGANSAGTVFKISTNGTLTNLYFFTGGNDGENPQAGLVQGSDGYFYGTTQNGGTNSDGTVFKITPDGILTTLYAFGSITNGEGWPQDGANPYAGLVKGSDGNFYGTTEYHGTNDYNNGTVFEIDTNGALTNLYSFGAVTNADGSLLNGANPYAGLVQASNGSFYGTTAGGGNSVYLGSGGGLIPCRGCFLSYGTVFKISTNEAFTLYAFGTVTNADGFPLDGANPYAGLVQGSDGSFYGTTAGGGPNGPFSYATWGNGRRTPVAGYGTVFRISTNGALTTLYAFGSITNASGDPLDGANPYAGLVQGSDGSFYGTTYDGGAYTNQTNSYNGGSAGSGTIFRLTIVPEFQAMALTNSTLNLTWSTEAGGTYQLQYTSDLSSGNWINLGSPFIATGATLSTADSVTNAPQRFYRLVLVP